MGRWYERRAPLQTAGLVLRSWVPAHVRVVGDWVEWNGAKNPIDLSSESAALDRFVEISTGEDAAAFVRRYGDLSLYPERVPNGNDEAWRERVEVYVVRAAQLRTLFDAANSLRQGRPLALRDLQAIGVVHEPGNAPVLGLLDCRVALGIQVSLLAAQAGLSPWVQWGRRGFQIGVAFAMHLDESRAFDAGHRQIKVRRTADEYHAPRPSRLWGHLVSCLVRFLLDGDTLHTCTRCGRLHSRQRAPNRSGGPAYCPECRKAVASERVLECRARKVRRDAPD